VLVRSGAYDLGEAREADPDQVALLAGFGLLLSKLVVSDLLERQVHRALVVARVVLEPGRGLERELAPLDKVLLAELGRIDADLVRGFLAEPLDHVRGLGHAERAA